MKKALLPCLSLVLATSLNAQTILIEEAFDTYTLGSAMAANDPANWTPWPGGDDQVVDTAQAASGTNSMACISNSAANGGPGDLLLLLGDKTAGVYELSWSMYIPTGKGGYFNIQHAEDVTTPAFAAEVIFSGSAISGTANATELTGAFPHDTWFEVSMSFDLNAVSATIAVNDVEIITFPFNTETDGAVGLNQLGCIDFFSFGGGSDLGEYYIDDVLYSDLTGIGFNEILSAEPNSFPNPTNNLVTLQLAHALGSGAVVELVDVTGVVVATPLIIASNKLRFDLSDLSDGVYFARITDGVKQIVEKVVKN